MPLPWQCGYCVTRESERQPLTSNVSTTNATYALRINIDSKMRLEPNPKNGPNYKFAPFTRSDIDKLRPWRVLVSENEPEYDLYIACDNCYSFLPPHLRGAFHREHVQQYGMDDLFRSAGESCALL